MTSERVSSIHDAPRVYPAFAVITICMVLSRSTQIPARDTEFQSRPLMSGRRRRNANPAAKSHPFGACHLSADRLKMHRKSVTVGAVRKSHTGPCPKIRQARAPRVFSKRQKVDKPFNYLPLRAALNSGTRLVISRAASTWILLQRVKPREASQG